MASDAAEDEPPLTESGGFSGSTTRRRDPDLVRAGLERWLPSLLDAERVRVTDLQIPSGAGFSNDTYLCILHRVRSLGGFPADADLGRLNPAAAFVRRELERRGVCAA
jgi:hypothetical protein